MISVHQFIGIKTGSFKISCCIVDIDRIDLYCGKKSKKFFYISIDSICNTRKPMHCKFGRKNNLQKPISTSECLQILPSDELSSVSFTFAKITIFSFSCGKLSTTIYIDLECYQYFIIFLSFCKFKIISHLAKDAFYFHVITCVTMHSS